MVLTVAQSRQTLIGFVAALLPLAFIIARRWCISLQRHDEQALLHGYETGIIMRSPDGGYSERHLPISDTAAGVTSLPSITRTTLGNCLKSLVPAP